jgi:P-type Cu+ transporter
VVLMGDRLWQLVEAVDLGRATLAKIRQNLVWALGYNALGLPLAAGVALPGMGVALHPSAAAAMMAFSSVAVVTNSLLLRLTPPPVAPADTAGDRRGASSLVAVIGSNATDMEAGRALYADNTRSP